MEKDYILAYLDKQEAEVRAIEGEAIMGKLSLMANFFRNIDMISRYSDMEIRSIKENDNYERIKNDLLAYIDMAKVVVEYKKMMRSGTITTITNENYQEQHQSINIEEYLQNGLSKEDYSTLMELVKKNASKETILDKVKGMGLDVVGGVLTNIISSILLKQ